MTWGGPRVPLTPALLLFDAVQGDTRVRIAYTGLGFHIEVVSPDGARVIILPLDVVCTALSYSTGVPV